MRVKSVTVFCGATAGRAETHLLTAAALGGALARAGLRLVYGGAAVGLMGAVADGALDAGGSVIGVIPGHLMRSEIAHSGLTELHIVPDMHRRKALMAELGDAFVALPGGFGTIEEMFETLTWSQLRLHNKPCVLLNHDDYYSSLLSFLRRAEHEGFISQADIERLAVCRRPEEVVDHLVALADTSDTHTFAGPTELPPLPPPRHQAVEPGAANASNASHLSSGAP
ncbi:TIGR00730 family Rossman fold protein [Streptomyces sp. NPDC101455]|uniref:LOG family protein n=1 Tax=Streptomyces sp. NPDC101455 TaxID=3366142 RepID=UPI00381C7132